MSTDPTPKLGGGGSAGQEFPKPDFDVDTLVKQVAEHVETLTKRRDGKRRDRKRINAEIKALTTEIDKAGRVARSLAPRGRVTP